jgi:thermitase
MKRISEWLLPLLCVALITSAMPAHASPNISLKWRAKENLVDADIQKSDLVTILKIIAHETGWKVYVDPGASNSISVKFKDLSGSDALRHLLGNLNYTKDSTNGVSRLFVYRAVPGTATELIKEEKKDYRIADQLLVKLKHSGDTNSIDQLAKKLGAKILKRDDRIGLYQLQFANGDSADTALQALASDPSIAAAENNYIVDPPSPAQIAQTATPPGALFNLNPQPVVNGPIVGMVDTDVDAPSEFQKYMLTPIDVVGDTGTPTDAPSHGTSMLETMLGAMSANPSMIQPVIVYGDNESTTTMDLMEGILAAINAGANPINVSSGGTGDSQMLGSLIQEATQKGIEIVAAAGNTPGTEDTYPAAYPGVLAVTAAAPNGQLASYADDGKFVDAMAPGTALVEWDNGTWEVQGTSPATADVTGTIAELMNGQHMTLQQAVNQISKSMPPPPSK